MKRRFDRIAETIFLTALAILNICTTCWAGPPGPPSIPSTPVGNAEVSAATIIAVAAYGYWKNRK
jgi:hypothetical protein